MISLRKFDYIFFLKMKSYSNKFKLNILYRKTKNKYVLDELMISNSTLNMYAEINYRRMLLKVSRVHLLQSGSFETPD